MKPIQLLSCSWLLACAACGPGFDVYEGLPAVGGINMLEGGELKVKCTGTLIGRFTVLTAAHCVVGHERQEMEFVVNPDATRPGPATRFRVVGRLPHPGYDPTASYANDIALLYLDPRRPPPEDIQRLHLIDADLAKTVLGNGEPLLFVGYGYIRNADNYLDGLGRKRAGSMATTPSSLKPTTFFYSVPGKNTCEGDSGGPALWPDSGPGLPVIVGVTSWGDGSCERFGFNTRVDAYLDFLSPRNIDVLPAPR